MQPHATAPWAGRPAYTEAERVVRAQAFLAAARTRRTCRNFSDTLVAREVIEAALLTAGTAPSGANHQPWHFAVICSPEIKARIRSAAEIEEAAFYAGKAGSEWLEALAPLGTDADKSYLEIAPWLIVIFGQRRGGLYPGESKQNYYVTESVGIATGMLLLALHDAGLTTLTHTPNPMGFLTKLLGRPSTEKPMMVVVVGHAAPDATIPIHALIKKPLDQISSWF